MTKSFQPFILPPTSVPSSVGTDHGFFGWKLRCWSTYITRVSLPLEVEWGALADVFTGKVFGRWSLEFLRQFPHIILSSKLSHRTWLLGEASSHSSLSSRQIWTRVLKCKSQVWSNCPDGGDDTHTIKLSAHVCGSSQNFHLATCSYCWVTVRNNWSML